MKICPFVFVTLYIIIIFACAGGQENNGQTYPGGKPITSDNLNQIAGVKWNLTKMIVDNEARQLVKDSETTFRCDQDGKVTGKATINRYSANIELQENGKISWGKAFIMTRMAGPPALMEQELSFSQALVKTSRMYARESRLIMISSDRSTVLEFEPSN